MQPDRRAHHHELVANLEASLRNNDQPLRIKKKTISSYRNFRGGFGSSVRL
jgi:hypothetical protein